MIGSFEEEKMIKRPFLWEWAKGQREKVQRKLLTTFMILIISD